MQDIKLTSSQRIVLHGLDIAFEISFFGDVAVGIFVMFVQIVCTIICVGKGTEKAKTKEGLSTCHS